MGKRTRLDGQIKTAGEKIVPDKSIVRKIYLFRGHKVMLDRDLAALYGVETKILNQAVKRNIARFPKDFMFQLNKKEVQSLRSQIVTSSHGGRRTHPFAFTEQGVAMLSGIINSEVAIRMNIAIMRAFVEIRKIAVQHKSIAEKMKLLEERLGEHDVQLGKIYDTIETLLNKKTEEETWSNRRRIGFKQK